MPTPGKEGEGFSCVPGCHTLQTPCVYSFSFEAESHYTAQAGLELEMTFLPQPPTFWDRGMAAKKRLSCISKIFIFIFLKKHAT